jgi:hypothetical protein
MCGKKKGKGFQNKELSRLQEDDVVFVKSFAFEEEHSCVDTRNGDG